MPSKRSTFKSNLILRPLIVALIHAGCATSALAQGLAAGLDPLPANGVVKAGVAEITKTSATSMLVKQESQRAVIEWQTFNLETKHLLQNIGPNASSMTVYRVVGDQKQPSSIFGQITANNRLFLINPSGIFVGGGAVIDAASIVLSSKDLDPSLTNDNYANLMKADALKFNTDPAFGQYGVPEVRVDPAATLKAGEGGAIMLIGGNSVRNLGDLVVGSGGQVVLAAVGEAEVDVGDSGFLTLKSVGDDGKGATRTAINEGTIEAPNGHVQILTFGAGEGGSVFLPDSYDTLVDAVYELGYSGAFNTGEILAQGSGGGQGQVDMRAVGVGSVVGVSGTIDVSALDAKSNAGAITLSGPTVRVGLDQTVNPDREATVLRADGVAGGGQIALDDSSATAGSPTGWIYVAKGSTLSADATESGNGGSITLSTLFDQSQNVVNRAPQARADYGLVEFYGTAQARSGAASGDGGSVSFTGGVVNTRYTWDAGNLPTSYVGKVNVAARSATGRGGAWQVNAPNLNIAAFYTPTGQSQTYVPYYPFNYILQDDINDVLNQGGQVTMSSHRDGQAADQYGGDVNVWSGTSILRNDGGGTASLTLIADGSVLIGAGSSIRSNSDTLNISLLADAAERGAGTVDMAAPNSGQSSTLSLAQPLDGISISVPLAFQTQIATLGGDFIIAGAQPSGEQRAAGANIYAAKIDTRSEDGAGQVVIQAHAKQEGTSSANGVTLSEVDIQASGVYIRGFSDHGTGVSLNNTTLTANGGTLDIRGVATGASNGSAIGVDIGSAVQLNAGSGDVVIAGRGTDQGVRIRDLVITSSGVAGQQITLAGQSVGSSLAGLGLAASGASPIRIHDANSETLASAADLIVGATAGPGAANALDLGSGALKPQFNITGRENFRPLGVDTQGQIIEAPSTAIAVGTAAPGAATNFAVMPEWFNVAQNAKVAPVTVIGANGHRGQIGVAAGALDGANNVTLQNQGIGSAGLVLGGNKDGASTGTLSLLTAGPISQTGAIRAQALNLIATAGAQVNLTNPGNRFGTLSVDGVTIQSIAGQSVPAASTTSGIPGYSTTSESPEFQTLAINTAPNRNQDSEVPETGPFDQPKPFELPQAFDEQRSDVYVRDHFNRPQFCTVASVSSVGLGLDADIEPLTLEWIKVRRSPQLSSCSGVRLDSACSAF